MHTSLPVRAVAAMASVCTTLLLLTAVVSLSEPRPNGGSEIAKVPLVVASK
jgi:hypothetical protein